MWEGPNASSVMGSTSVVVVICLAVWLRLSLDAMKYPVPFDALFQVQILPQ